MSKTKNDYYDALDKLLDRPIAFNPAFKRITGRTSAAVWLSQVYYWSKRTSNPDGWFYKTAKECQEETGLTDNEQKTAREICVKLGVVQEKLKGVPATMYYRLIRSRMYELLDLQFPTEQETEIPAEQETSKPQSSNQDSRDSVNINKKAEITTEITQRDKDISEACKIFEKIKDSLERTLPRNSMTFLRAARPLRFEDSVLTLAVQDAPTRDMMESRMSKTIERAMPGIIGGEASVEFVVGEQV